jgi:hypothetical protein
MFKEKIPISIMLVFLLFVYSCEGGKMREETVPLKDEVTVKESLKKVAGQRIFFGHQSVGYNIIDGLGDLAHENPQTHLNIIESNEPAMLDGNPAFVHSPVGHNTDPVSKLDDFSKFLDRGIAGKVDIAVVKFCYVDITQGADIQKIFGRYKESLERLKKEYPQVTFVHVTVPLTSEQSDIKTIAKNLIKRIIGRPVRSHKDNIPRNRYNEMLKKEYEGKDPVFDLAGIESTHTDGSRVIHSEEGSNFYSLAPEYTEDGGHLNKQGRRIVAIHLVNFLANLSAQNINK